VFRNYEAELKKAGFEPIFTCRNEICGGRNFNHSVAEYGIFGDLYEDQHYLAARLKRAEGDVYTAIYVALGSVRGGPRDTPYVQVDVIETRPMETGMVTVDAAAMRKGLTAEGHVALYNIYFGTDSADIAPASKPALDEVAKLLRSQPELKLLVIGHTDNVGEIQYNLGLSQRRATAVVRALQKGYAIKPERLTAAGVGMYAPVASNKSEDGRAKNRRVELVER
jgi:outer membrane protein OmpA-like peptidoglycan-associated protein